MNWRHVNIRNLSVAFLIVALGVFVRLGQVHIFDAADYRLQANRQYQPLTELPAPRGNFLDRNGDVMVTSMMSSSVYAFPELIPNANETVEDLSSILDIPAESIANLFQRSPYFVWLDRNISAEQAREIGEMNLRAIGMANTYKRVNVAGGGHKLLGSVNVDLEGISGLELQYNHYLRGLSGSLSIPKDAIGRPIWSQMPEYNYPVPGNHVYLTIDQRILFFVERALTKAIEETDALRGVAIAMNPKDGSIYAIADILGPRSAPDAMFWPVVGVYEPGSVFKSFTAYMALEKGIVTPETVFETDWKLQIGRYQISNYGNGRNHVWRKTFKEALAQSDNVVFALVGQELGADGIQEMIERFRFGQKTGIDYPGEAVGLLPRQLGPTEIATISYGHGIAVSPLQLVRGYSALVNGGYLPTPWLVSKIETPKGQVIYEHSPEEMPQVLDRDVANTVKDMLVSVVESGTGRSAAVSMISVGGKTGTGQKATVGGYGKSNTTTFIGFGPAEDPDIVLLVMLDEPKSALVQTGGWVAAPLFAEIMEDLLRYWSDDTHLYDLDAR